MQLLNELVPSQSGEPEAKDGEESSSWTWKPHLSGVVLVEPDEKRLQMRV